MSTVFDIYGFRINPSTHNTIDKDKFYIKEVYNKRKIILIVISILLVIIYLLSCIFSAFIAWNCYRIDLNYVRIFKTIIAFWFPYIYLPYIFLLRVILKQPCL